MMRSEFKEYFKNLLGEENAHFDSIHQRAYNYDVTKKHYLLDGVLSPRNEEDISEILKYCNDGQVIVVPRGSGSDFIGGALAVNGGLILSFEKHMNQVLEIDLENLVAVVQLGVINIALQEEVAKHKFFYPPDPASMEYSSLGGNVSRNAGGMRAAKYGITKDYVMVLRAVLTSGDIIRAGKRTTKDVAGYNLAGVLIASEGFLAVLSGLTLKLIPMPKLKKTTFATFASVKKATDAVYKSLAGGVNPVSMEFLNHLGIKAVEEKFHKGLNVGAGATLIRDVDGNVRKSVEEDLECLGEHSLEAGAMEFKITQNESEAADMWFARRNCSQSIATYGTLKFNEDITVPYLKLPEFLEGIEQISQKYDFEIPCLGHTGDGNVHTNVVVKDKDDKEQVRGGHEAVEEISKFVVGLGGTLSGEHGIGISKAPFMNLAFSEAELNLIQNIKKTFDPNNTLNPFKMGL